MYRNGYNMASMVSCIGEDNPSHKLEVAETGAVFSDTVSHLPKINLNK